MATSREHRSLGSTVGGGPSPSVSPGPLGMNDQADPIAMSSPGDSPGPVGVNDHADPRSGLSAGARQKLRFFPQPVLTYGSPRVGFGVSDHAQYPPEPAIAYGKRVSARFKKRVIEIAAELETDPNYLMAAMAFESAGSFSAAKRNPSSGAVGLIQFTDPGAKAVGKSKDELAKMSAEDQLEYVRLYLLHFKGKLKTLEDVYMAILWPAAVGKSDDYVLFTKDESLRARLRALLDRDRTPYGQNAALDSDKDGRITKKEAAARVWKEHRKGMQLANSG